MAITAIIVWLEGGNTQGGEKPAIADLLAQFLREEEFLLDDEAPGEVDTTKVAEE